MLLTAAAHWHFLIAEPVTRVERCAPWWKVWRSQRHISVKNASGSIIRVQVIEAYTQWVNLRPEEEMRFVIGCMAVPNMCICVPVGAALVTATAKHNGQPVMLASRVYVRGGHRIIIGQQA